MNMCILMWVNMHICVCIHAFDWYLEVQRYTCVGVNTQVCCKAYKGMCVHTWCKCMDMHMQVVCKHACMYEQVHMYTHM